MESTLSIYYQNTEYYDILLRTSVPIIVLIKAISEINIPYQYQILVGVLVENSPNIPNC